MAKTVAFAFSWSRMTGWRPVRIVEGGPAFRGARFAHGLRHGFRVAAVSADIPLNLVQKWLGHAQLLTIVIYADAIGAEEQDTARRMWG